jgi:hypothetical protein
MCARPSAPVLERPLSARFYGEWQHLNQPLSVICPDFGTPFFPRSSDGSCELYKSPASNSCRLRNQAELDHVDAGFALLESDKISRLSVAVNDHGTALPPALALFFVPWASSSDDDLPVSCPVVSRSRPICPLVPVWDSYARSENNMASAGGNDVECCGDS